jgi:RHS repeat-associated protein
MALSHLFHDFDEKGRILQQTDYYPFGLEIDRNVPVQSQAARNAVNWRNFLGKETQVGTGYIDMSRRFFDPTIGRFMQVDPVTEGQENQSTYQYGWNNPILRSDPNGDYPDGGDDPFLIARLVTTAFFDTKHAIINTAARAFGSDIRAGYKVEDGQQVFETQISRQAVDNSLGGQVKEAVNAVADVALVATAGSSPANPGNLMVKASESQVIKTVKEATSTRAGMPFTRKGRTEVLDANAAKNQGKIVCEGCGVNTTKPEKSTRGVTPPKTDHQVDHVVPKVKGGPGAPENGQVLCRDCNVKKSDN